MEALLPAVPAVSLTVRDVTGETTVHTPDAPFADKAAMKLWVKQVVRKIANAEVKKAVRVDQEPIAL